MNRHANPVAMLRDQLEIATETITYLRDQLGIETEAADVARCKLAFGMSPAQGRMFLTLLKRGFATNDLLNMAAGDYADKMGTDSVKVHMHHLRARLTGTGIAVESIAGGYRIAPPMVAIGWHLLGEVSL